MTRGGSSRGCWATWKTTGSGWTTRAIVGEGLPWTTSHVESTVKVFNRRVKGSEKFWSEAGAEAILQLRAAFLSEDGRLDRHLKERPCSPFRNYKARKTGEAA